MTRLEYDLTGIVSNTDRVAELMAAEYRPKEIATILGLQVNHVRVAMTRIRRKMGEGPK